MDRLFPASPGPWRKQAACRGTSMQTSTFGAATNRVTAADRVMIAAALRLCYSCPVLEPCETWALSDPEPAVDMVAGGFTPRQRRQIRLGRQA